MKVGTYTRLSAPVLGCALLWTSAACGSRTSLLFEEDAGVTTETPAQESNTGNSGGRAGSSTTGRAGRGGAAAAGAGGMGGRAATGGRSGRAGRGGEAAEQPRGGAGGRTDPRDRDAAADSGEDEEQPSAGSGGEQSGGSGGEQAGAAGDTAGAGGEGAAGEGAAGSGGSDAGPADAGSEPTEPTEPTDRLTALTPEQTTEICDRIESSTANEQWTEAVRGWCSRGSLGTPECTASQESCVNGPMIIPICSETVPDCPDITIEEFVVCRTDSLLSFVAYNREITCDTPPGLPGEAPVPSCEGPYQRCAALAGLAR